MKKDINSIGYEIPGHSDLLVEFSSGKSLMDSDIILMSPILPWYEKSSAGDGYYQGKVCYGESGSFKLKKDFAHWKKELTDALGAGKTVFLMLTDKEDFFVDTGSRTHSGSGRNRTTTINVAPLNNYELLPIRIGSVHSAKGKAIYSTGNSLFNDFLNAFGPNFEYQVYVEDVQGTPIFVGKDKTKVLAAVYTVGIGRLVTLPFVDFDREKFVKTKKDKAGKEQGYWTPEAIGFGDTLISCLVEIDGGLSKKSQKTPAPAWLADPRYDMKNELIIQEKIRQNIAKIAELKTDKESLNLRLEKEQALKDLLFEQSRPLELAVTEALVILGFKAENYDDGILELDQVITSPEGVRYIGECEGKDNKDIDITKFRQLMESMNADFARDEVEEKALGILFGNSQRLEDPQNRTLDFTQKCKIGATREKIALVKTIDLFEVAKFLKENPDDTFQKKCRDAIYDGLGKIVVFPDVQSKAKQR